MKNLPSRAKKIRLFLSDVDGVLTDAGMYYSEEGDELKKFSTYDGGGFLLLKLVGIQTGILTSENTALVERRARKLRLDHVLQGYWDKTGAFHRLLETLGLTPDQVAYIGDDINDLPILRQVGIAAVVPDHCLPADFQPHYITTRKGGSGAVRDFAEWLLRLRGEYELALERYFEFIQKQHERS